MSKELPPKNFLKAVSLAGHRHPPEQLSLEKPWSFGIMVFGGGHICLKGKFRLNPPYTSPLLG